MSYFTKTSFWLSSNMNLNWFCECFVNWPFIFSYPFANHGIRQIKFITPLTHGEGFAVISNYLVTSSIIALCLLRSPFHIAWFVIAIIIYSINAMLFGWLKPNVSDKAIKRFVPWHVKLNSTSAVQMIILRFWIIASGLYCLPCKIFCCAALSMNWRSANFLYIGHVFKSLVRIKILKASEFKRLSGAFFNLNQYSL